jgi:hypothetical protein
MRPPRTLITILSFAFIVFDSNFRGFPKTALFQCSKLSL